MAKVRKDVTEGLDEDLYQRALSSGAVLQGLIEGISPERKSNERRHESAQILIAMSVRDPGRLSDQWDVFAAYLKSGNAFSQYPALYVLANLSLSAAEKRMDLLLDDYINMLSDPAVSIAGHAALNLGRLAKHRNDLAPGIIEGLLNVDALCRNKGRLDLIKSYVLEALNDCYDCVSDRDRVASFAERLLTSGSPKTRKMAQEFIRMRKE